MSVTPMEPLVGHTPRPDDPTDVRTQLERLLRSSHFRNSRRYPALLRFIVEEALEGRGSLLKERTLGVEVFARAPDYDTASDPIVRVTVAEVRKRIAQYYHEDAHASELRIELNPGSYMPEFLPGREYDEMAHEPVSVVAPAGPATAGSPAGTEAARTVATAVVMKRRWPTRWLLSAAALLVVAAIASGVWRWEKPDALAELWAPLLSATGPLTYCLPMNARRNNPGRAETTSEAIAHVMDLVDPPVARNGSFLDHELLGENVVYSDVVAMAKIEAVVERQSRPVRVRLNLSTSLNELREGPTIFLGGLNNQWTLQMLDSLRYRFAGSDADQFYVRDATDPGNKQWAVRLRDKMTTVNRDYAIVARLHNEEFGQPVMIVAGIGMSGTAAAGEFLADPKAAKELQNRMGARLKDSDFEAVLQTDVVNGIAGPAKIVVLDVR